ncbi:hypothetical protein BJY14_007744 [Actinomadura luteofluorescens]|uniref:Uncharacterized protein n=1 Tax=Actinomadura luteofluorescens TaxID=46163 RepID=A0A7Y9EPX2_9ACTN|nr:hypothetical protein [Actinomadura luteofluorescens]
MNALARTSHVPYGTSSQRFHRGSLTAPSGDTEVSRSPLGSLSGLREPSCADTTRSTRSRASFLIAGLRDPLDGVVISPVAHGRSLNAEALTSKVGVSWIRATSPVAIQRRRPEPSLPQMLDQIA